MADLELVVFDWDGTLMDSTAAIVAAIQGAAADLELPVPTRSQAAHVIGLGLHEALAHAVPSLPPERLPAFVERYRVHYFRRDPTLAPFEGIDALLAELDAAGVPMAVATGKSRVGLDRALEQTGWARRFVASRCADEGRPKPDPWMLRDLCTALDTAPERTVMIGDTTHDLDMAIAAGTRAVAVTWGAHPAASLASRAPDAAVDSVEALRAWLAGRVRRWR